MAKARKIRVEWGNWKLKPENMILELESNNESLFKISLNECYDSFGILNNLYQVYNKSWSTAKVMKDLLSAIDDIIFPQINVCLNREISFTSPKDIVDAYMKRGPDKINKMHNLLYAVKDIKLSEDIPF